MPACRIIRCCTTAALFAIVAAGCGYTSEYVAPQDGRVRAVWKSDDVVVELAGAHVSSECNATLDYMAGGGALAAKLRLKPPSSFWTPTYYGPPIVVMTPGLAPLLPLPPLFLPPPLRPPIGGPVRVPAPGTSSSSGSSSKWGEAGTIILVVALVVLPVVDLLLATLPPESSKKSSEAIDGVNAFNDLARLPGTPCSYYPPPPEGAP